MVRFIILLVSLAEWLQKLWLLSDNSEQAGWDNLWFCEDDKNNAVKP